MPVIDHPVHPSTQISQDHRYGCWNRPLKFKPFYWAPERRTFPDGSFEMMPVRIPFRMSHTCHHDGIEAMGVDDPACEGCKHYKASK